MKHYADTLVSFCGALGLTAEFVAKHEDLERLAFQERVASSSLKSLIEQDCTALIDCFEDALTITLGSEHRPYLSIEDGTLSNNLDRVKNLESDEMVDVKVVVRKEILQAQLSAPSGCHTMLFFFKKSLNRFLAKKNLALIDAKFFSTEKEFTCILVSDCTGFHLEGPFLVITGGCDPKVSDSRPAPAVAPSAFREKFSAFDRAGYEFSNLTPLHLDVERIAGEPDETDEILKRQSIALWALFLANRSQWIDDDGFRAYFSNSEKTVCLDLDSETGAKALDKNREALIRVWPQKSADTFLLTFFQNAVTKSLGGDDGTANYREFVNSLERFLADAQWHRRVFLDGKIDEHFSELQSAQDYVSSSAREIGKEIDSLVKGLTDTATATIGLVTITVLTLVVRSAPRATDVSVNGNGSGLVSLLQGVVCLYILYLIVFAILYRLGSMYGTYKTIHEEVEERKKHYKETLGSRIEPFFAQWQKRQSRFCRWFAGVLFAHLAIIFALLGFVAYLRPLLKLAAG